MAGSENSVSDTAAGDLLMDLDRQRQALETAWLETLGEFAERGLHAVDGAPSAVSWVGHRCERARRSVSADVKTAHQLRRMPIARAALAGGTLSPAKAALLGRARAKVPGELFADHEAALVPLVSELTVDQAAIALRFWLARAEAELASADESLQDPAETRRARRALYLIVAAVDACYDQLRRKEDESSQLTSAQRRADALTDLVLAGHEEVADSHTDDGGAPDDGDSPDCSMSADGGQSAGRGHCSSGGQLQAATSHGRLQLPFIGLLDLNALAEARAVVGEITGGVPLAGDSARRLLCDTAIARVVFNGSEPIDLGRQRREPSLAQRRALVARDRGCAFPGCDRPPRFCDAHHLVLWTKGGSTNLSNLALVCRYHHHLVHEGGFALSRAPTGELTAHRPDGSVITSNRRRPPTLFEQTGTASRTKPPPGIAA